jgi:hypothetical protein
VLFQDRQDLGRKCRRPENAAGSPNRLGDECGDRVRPFALDQPIELRGEPLCELLLVLVDAPKTMIIGRSKSR